MQRRATIALTGLVVLVAVAQGCRHRGAPPLAFEVSDQGPLVFPPPDVGWEDRAPLPPRTSSATLAKKAALTIDSPSLDDEGHFETQGKTIRLYFDDEVAEARDPKKAPRVTIAPAVRGKTVWTSRSVEFVADAPFDPDTTYTLTLPELTSTSGNKLEGGFRATFNARPLVEVAGKTIDYLPKHGHARAIVAKPSEGKLGGAQEIAIVWDQPIDLSLAQRLVRLTRDGDKPVPAVLSRTGGVFEGQSVDARYVVVVRPRAPLAPAAHLGVTIRPQVDGEPGEQDLDFEIAEPTSLVSATCTNGCDVEGTKLRGSSGSSVNLKFNNSLGYSWEALQRHVHVSPAPKNLYASAWGEEISISASFRPSTTYRIRVDGVRDAYGGVVAPVAATFETRPLPASATLAADATLLDDAGARAFPLTTRNVERVDLKLWALPKGDAAAFGKALDDARAGNAPTTDPVVVPVTPRAARDTLADTLVDLSSKLERGRPYVVAASIAKPTAGAEPATYPDGSDASRASLAVVFPTGPDALGAHVHQVGEQALVQVFRLGTGEPVGGARVAIGDRSATTDALGTAIVDGAPRGDGVVSVSAGDAALMLPLRDASSTAAASLYPDLASGTGAARADRVGMIVTDRGVYRPGSTMHVKGIARKVQNASLRPLAGAKVKLRVVDPTGAEVRSESLVTNAHGFVARDVAFDANGHTGRFQVRLEDEGGDAIAEETVRVADFERPKFKVDVEAKPGDAPPNQVHAKVVARYLFGAPMSGGSAQWTLRKHPAPIPGGDLADAGLSFERGWDAFEDRPASDGDAPVTGEGKLGEDGALAVDATIGPPPRERTEIQLDADVTDASNRHVSGQLRLVKDPFARHAGLRVRERFGEAGSALKVELGAVDAKSAPAVGAKVTARLERVRWTRAATRAESGATLERWHTTSIVEASCVVTAAARPVPCELPVRYGGDYRVVASVDGHDGASVPYWAWGGYGRGWSDGSPSSGKKIPLALDKARYASGETAKLLVRSPFAKATAVLTIEEGGLLRHETRRVEGPSAVFDVPVSAANAPWVYAAVTLLPIGDPEADYRVGVVRVPVSADDAKLRVSVTSAKKAYGPRDEAEITVSVTKGDRPVANADVALAVVDEGVLRLTNHHVKDPALALRAGLPLGFRASDSRAALLRRRERAHVAGGGDGEGEEPLDTRRNFVETAAWLPNLLTDAQGRVTAKVRLADDLTELRMMAVALDDDGAGGAAESSFVVTKPILLEPVLPRFALRGDAFEAAAMVHNTTDAPIAAKVTVAGQDRDVTIAAHGHARVAAPMTTDAAGTQKLRFAVAVGGAVKDAVEVPLRVEAAGLDEHPQLSGAFTGTEEIALAVPADAIFEPGAALAIKTGSALYPELGQRVSYLLDYPHGCVEQTTSSTVPLLAARTLLPWTGTTAMPDEEIRKRIRAGVERLASMQTDGGGLAYWPHGSEPNVFGTAYATRLLLRARDIGIEHPGLVEGATKFLTERLGSETAPEVRVSIAEVLAQAKALPESAADGLYDTREKLDAFGLASLAIALSSLPHQEDRVNDVLGRLADAFDAEGAPKKAHDERDWHYWGSHDRDRAQTVIALSRLRKSSRLLPLLAGRLARGLETYTTQSNAWSLLALSDYVGGRAPEGDVDVTVKLEGVVLDTYAHLGGDNKEVRIPLAELAGKHVKLRLGGDASTPTAFALEARYKRPFDAKDSRLGRHAPRGASVYRAYSDASGKPIDLANVPAGQVVRVALRVELPALDPYRLGYVAVTDRLPAGLAPIDPDLASTSYVTDLSPEHPFYDGLSGYAAGASHVDLRDDRVQLYFDRTYGGRTLYATYLARATTPGSFAAPPARGELMYEAGSEGLSDAARMTIR